MFSIDPDEREESTDLKLVFLITIILVGLEFFVMFNKQNFFTMLGMLLLAATFMPSYFEKKYVRLLLAWFTISLVFDILWMLFRSDVHLFLFRLIGTRDKELHSHPFNHSI